MHIFCYKMLYNGVIKLEKSACFSEHLSACTGACILERFAQNYGYVEKLLMLRLFQKVAGNPVDDTFYLSKPCIQLALCWSHPQL